MCMEALEISIKRILKNHGANLCGRCNQIPSFNLTGHDCLAEQYQNLWDFEHVDGAVTRFEECVANNRSAIDFTKPFSEGIVLQGHSMGWVT